ncbi:hypothetical protein [Streptomyces resistomycificus]|uniref:hypothetical protein n=1 Tax=Streptomyces resistomycificus TaxID=67356 RepID=UPI00068AC8D5|nr:hypothetical protein [Streptomyces resistomycificus]KUN92348.1 hypothetical protein AQJ84_33210 [Streptomyces resistomycificus]
MGREPSGEDMLEAVEAHVVRRGVTTRLTAPGTADLTWQPLLDFRVVRCVETRGERPMRRPGGPGEVADRPTYTDVRTHRVHPPADPGRHEVHLLVRRGSLDEVPCDGCRDGSNECGACDGRGRRDCPRFVDCSGCQGGPDSCWECEGTGRPRTRRATRPRHPYATTLGERPARTTCKRCRIPDVACPKCRGRRQLDCPACDKAGYVECEQCAGTRRVTHQECEGTGRFTEWTEGWVHHTPHHDKERRLGRLDLRRPTGGLGAWRTAELTSATDKLPDDLDDAHRELITPRLAVREGEVARRVTLRHLPLAHVRVHADPHRDYYAFPSHTGIEVVARPTGERVRHFAAITAAVVVLVTFAVVLVVAAAR